MEAGESGPVVLGVPPADEVVGRRIAASFPLPDSRPSLARRPGFGYILGLGPAMATGA
jgi:hypothetical protein